MMNRAQLHVGEVWQVRLGGLIEGERQIVALYAKTVALSSPFDASVESRRWADVQFLNLLRRSNGKAPLVLP
jgi:hypothetical protein